jgi:hypothetical protein
MLNSQNKPRPMDMAGPLRLPHWRLNRVLHMLKERPLRPPPWFREGDDRMVRTYRLTVLVMREAEDDSRRDFDEFRPMVEAHQCNYSPDPTIRQELEAWLLTEEPYEKIAQRFFMSPQAVEFFEQIFFNVRDRLENSDLIQLAIHSRKQYDQEAGCSPAEIERGYVLRHFAYIGGPQVLNALVQGFAQASPPERSEDVTAWCQELVSRALNIKVAVAAETLELTNANKLRLIKLLQQKPRRKNSDEPAPGDSLDKRIADMLNKFQKDLHHVQQTPAGFTSQGLKTNGQKCGE